MVTRKVFSYDEFSDSLLVSNKAENERVRKNFMFGDFIISLTGNGKIVGLEIRDISNLFHEYGFDPNILNNIKDVELIVLVKKDFIFLGIKLIGIMKSQKFEQKIPLGYFPRQSTPITN